MEKKQLKMDQLFSKETSAQPFKKVRKSVSTASSSTDSSSLDPLSRAITQSQQPIKKLVIKSFKGVIMKCFIRLAEWLIEIVKPSLPVDYVEKTLERLGRAVEAIHASLAISDSLEDLYKVYNSLS